MKLYRVDTDRWSSKEFSDLKEAENKYEYTKDQEMGEGVDEDSYVQLVCSEDNFEDYEVIKIARVEVDEERMKISTPKDEGYDWDYWAKWKEYTE